MTAGWNEERLLRWLARTLRPERIVGRFGDDAAVLPALAARSVVCTDQVVVGVHCEPGTPGAICGRKACARTLSDLAATAARPRAVLLAICAPRTTSEAWLKSAIRAVDRRARDFGAELVGGDLAAGEGAPRLAVTALGALETGRRPPARDRARVGQLVVATGAFGGSRLGRHLRLEPRVAEGRKLHASGATALMDISDGLARDLARLARASGVGIDLEHVPLHRDALRAARSSGRSALDHALHDGEDHELVATLAPRAFERARRAWAGFAVPLTRIGRVRSGHGLRVRGADGTWSAWDGRGGWVHGES